MNFRKIFRKINITDASTGAAFCSKDVLSGCRPSLFSALVERDFTSIETKKLFRETCFNICCFLDAWNYT